MADKYELGMRMITLASQYRQLGEKLSVDAYAQLKAGSITRQTYDALHDNIENLFKQGIAINRAVADLTAGSIDADLTSIDKATGELKQATAKIDKIREIVKISLSALTAIGAGVVACTAPSAPTIAAAVGAATDLVQEITKDMSQTKD